MPNDLNVGFNRLDPNIIAAAGRILPSWFDQRIFYLDISQNNGTWRYDQTRVFNEMYSVPVEAFCIRSGQFDTSGWDDVQFVRNMEMAKSYEFPRAVYHVVGPNRSAEAQGGHLVNLLEKTGLPEGYVSIDLQLKHSQSLYTVSKRTVDMYAFLERELPGVDLNVYSAKWFTDQHCEKQSWMYSVNWWIAKWVYPSQAYEHPGLSQKDMPFDVPLLNCIAQQTTSNLDGILLGGGIEGTPRCDGNRWMYPRAHFNETFGIKTAEPGDTQERLTKLEAFMGVVLGKQSAIKEIL